MQRSGVLLRLDSYVAPPARIQATPREDPDSLRTWPPCTGGLDHRPASPRKESDHIG